VEGLGKGSRCGWATGRSEFAAVFIVLCAFFRIGEDLMSGLDGLKERDIFGLLSGIAIWMVLAGENSKRLFDIFHRG